MAYSRKRKRSPNRILQAARINSGLSREDLARRTGVSRETIRLAESGFTPGPRIQYLIAREFGRLPLDIWPLEHQRAAA